MRNPTDEERQAAHQYILEGFIKEAPELEGMVLCGIRPTEDGKHTAVEVTSAANIKDLIRTAAAVVDAVLQAAKREGADEEPQAELLRFCMDLLLRIAGDDPDEIEKTTGEVRNMREIFD